MTMKSLFLGLAPLACILATGCSSSLAVATQKFTNDPVTRTASFTWTGQTIQIDNVNGAVNLVPTPGLTTITLTATPFAFAGNQTDADMSIQEIIPNILITQASDGTIQIGCPEATATNGTAPQGQTGCDAFTVNIPQGTTDAPVNVQAKTGNGALQMSTFVIGSLTAQSGNGDVVADATPVVGSVIDVESQNGDVALKLPGTWSADVVTVSGSTVNTQVFPNLVSGQSYGTVGAGAKSITLTTQLGLAEIAGQ